MDLSRLVGDWMPWAVSLLWSKGSLIWTLNQCVEPGRPSTWHERSLHAKLFLESCWDPIQILRKSSIIHPLRLYSDYALHLLWVISTMHKFSAYERMFFFFNFLLFKHIWVEKEYNEPLWTIIQPQQLPVYGHLKKSIFPTSPYTLLDIVLFHM